MHKTHIFDQKKKCKFFFFTYLPTYPIFFHTVTGNKQYFFLGLVRVHQYVIVVWNQPDESQTSGVVRYTKKQPGTLYPYSLAG